MKLGPGDSEEYSLLVEEDIGDLKKAKFGYGPKEKRDVSLLLIKFNNFICSFSTQIQWDICEARFLHATTGQLYRFQMGAGASGNQQQQQQQQQQQGSNLSQIDGRPNAPANLWMLTWENAQNQCSFKKVPIGVFIIGDRDRSDRYDFTVNLEPGVSGGDKLEMDLTEIGEIEKVRLTFGEEAAVFTEWNISKMNLLHVKSGVVRTFNFKNGFKKKQRGDSTTEAALKPNARVKIYQVEFHTAFDVDRMELYRNDVRVKIIIRGDRGDTGERVVIDTETEGRVKERPGDVIKFDIEAVDVGEITGISFRHNKTGRKTWEFIKKMVVRPANEPDAEQSVEFDKMQ